MKVMNVGNANYANSRQQNFGMKLLPIGVERLKPEELTRLAQEVLPVRTISGKELKVIVDQVPGTPNMRISTHFDSGKGFRMVVSPHTHEGDCESTIINQKMGMKTMYEKVLVALQTMNRIIEFI